MNAIVADPPANHVHDVTGNGGFDVGGAAVRKVSWHQPNRSTINEGFADVAIVKHNGAVHGWNARFVAPDANASVHAPEHAGGVEQVFW